MNKNEAFERWYNSEQSADDHYPDEYMWARRAWQAAHTHLAESQNAALMAMLESEEMVEDIAINMFCNVMNNKEETWPLVAEDIRKLYRNAAKATLSAIKQKLTKGE